MISSIQVSFSDQKELNATTDLYRPRVKLMYMLKFQWEEKQDKKYIHKTYNRSGFLHNTAGSLLGKIQTAENEKLDVSVDHQEVEWDPPWIWQTKRRIFRQEVKCLFRCERNLYPVHFSS